MGGFFSMEGPFYRIGSVIADVLILSIMWLVLTVPVITSGAATTAVFYVTTRRISNKDGYLMRDFFKSFKRNFVQATLVWLVVLVVGIIIVVNILNINVLGDIKVFILPVQICMLIELTIITAYIFPIISRFDMKFTQVFKTAFFMANRHLLTSILCLLCGAAVIFLSAYYIPFIFMAFGAYAFATSYLILRIFKKYRPEIDADEDYESIQEKSQSENNNFR